MWNLSLSIFKTVKRRRLKMSLNGVSKDAPWGIQGLQALSSRCCPRLRINRLRSYQAFVLILTYFTYMTYHLTRKPISVVKNVLHQNCSALPPPPEPPANDQWCNWPPFNTTEANTLLGALDSAFLFSYAGAMFVSGMVAERVDLRYFLSIGMLLSAVFCYLFGLAKTYNIHHISYYILVQAGAGIAQTSGWPGTVATVEKWFGTGKKGLIFGIWNSHTSLGNILGTLMAAEFVDVDWALSFIYPALVMGVVGAIVWLFLPPYPALVGLTPGDGPNVSRVDTFARKVLPENQRCSTPVKQHYAEPSRQSRSSDDEDDTESDRDNLSQSQVVVGDQRDLEPTESTSLLSRPSSSKTAISLTRALKIPGVVQYSLSLFFAKLVSYTFLYWLPLYIKTSTNLSAQDSGKLSTVFDVGGAAGAILAGLLADRSQCPALVCIAFYSLAAPSLLAYQKWGASSYELNFSLLVITGVLVNGPYALITTAVSAELGTHSSLAGSSAAVATVTAIVDGTGSIGAALGPMLAGVVSSAGSWSYVFYMLIVCNFCALFLLLRVGLSEIARLRQERRIASPPRVRIE